MWTLFSPEDNVLKCLNPLKHPVHVSYDEYFTTWPHSVRNKTEIHITISSIDLEIFVGNTYD